VALKIDLVQALNNLGIAYFEQGKYDDAVATYQRALVVKPDYARAHCHLGNAYYKQGRYAEAVGSYRRALAIEPNYAEACSDLGTALVYLDRPDEAVANCRKALDLKPDYARAHHNLAFVLMHQGKPDAALASCQQAQALQPDFALAHDTGLLALLYRDAESPHEILAAHRRYAAQFEAPLRPLWPAHTNNRDPSRRLKIGYVSPDFRVHSVAYFMEPLLAHHDRRMAEIFCYYNFGVRDALTKRLMAYADHWLDCAGLTDAELAARIQTDGIDILVDLAGHTGSNRLLVFARKPAPVQVTYLGYVATTGLTAMDYRLSHSDADPTGYERYNSERLYRLPRSLWCYRPPLDMPAVEPVTPARRNGHITFGSLNNIAKISDSAIALWSRLLQALPGSRLIMADVALGAAQQHMYARFAAHGIAAACIELHPKLPHQSFRELHHRIDIALDPFPHNGNTTTCESLWMGVPVLSLIGDRFVARFGYLLLKTIGLAELAAHDEAEYLAIATALAQDLDRLDTLRGGMRARIESSPLRDEAGLTRDLETAYRAMWQQWCLSRSEQPS